MKTYITIWLVNNAIIWTMGACSSFSNRLYSLDYGKKESRNYEVEVVSDQLSLGEGPHWDTEGQMLYFVDMTEASIHSFNPSTNEHYSAVIKGDKYVTFIIPVEGKGETFMISRKNELGIISWDGKSSTEIEPQIIATFEPQDNERSLNDAKADSKGRLWTGTMHIDWYIGAYPSEGSVYSWSTTDGVKKHLEGVQLSNGIAWNSDNTIMYHVDTIKNCIFAYEYDLELGSIKNGRTFFNYTLNNMEGYPDGMTIDSEDNIFVASVAGSQILEINGQTGELISTIDVPVQMLTSVAFGGANLDELYVTTANYDENYVPLPPSDAADGRLLRITNLGTQGVPSMNVVY